MHLPWHILSWTHLTIFLALLQQKPHFEKIVHKNNFKEVGETWLYRHACTSWRVILVFPSPSVHTALQEFVFFPHLSMFAFQFHSLFYMLGIMQIKWHSHWCCHRNSHTQAYLPSSRDWRLPRMSQRSFWNNLLTGMEAKYLHSYRAWSVCVSKL